MINSSSFLFDFNSSGRSSAGRKDSGGERETSKPISFDVEKSNRSVLDALSYDVGGHGGM